MIKGQRVSILEITDEPSFDVGVTMNLSGPGEVGCVCFCLDGAGGLADARWLVYEDNAVSPVAAIRFMGAARGDSYDFQVTLGDVPEAVERIVFVAFVSGPGAMNQLAYGHLRLKSGERELVRYVLSGHDFGQEKAVMLAEIYRKGGEWRLHLNGQGFAEGIEGVFRRFGASELWEALSGPSPGDDVTEIVLTPEQAQEILAVLERTGHGEEEDAWPSQGAEEDGSPDYEDGEAAPGPIEKPPTLH
jgi:stress response protein SCP2